MVVPYENGGTCWNGRAHDARDIGGSLYGRVADPDRILITSVAKHTTADDDVVAARPEIGTSSVSQGNVEATRGIVVERIDAIGRVTVADCIFMKGTQTASRVEASLCIVGERGNTGGGILGTGS